MKRVSAVLFIAMLCVFAPLVAADDPRITADERAKLLKYLHDSQREFESLLADVSDAQWRWKPAPERWSVAETAEHIVIAEQMLFGLSNRAMASPRGRSASQSRP